jgi:hypothetical protein
MPPSSKSMSKRSCDLLTPSRQRDAGSRCGVRPQQHPSSHARPPTYRSRENQVPTKFVRCAFCEVRAFRIRCIDALTLAYFTYPKVVSVGAERTSSSLHTALYSGSSIVVHLSRH